MVYLDFESKFPRRMEEALQVFVDWLHERHPLKGEYSVKVFPAVDGFVDQNVGDISVVVVTRWRGGKRSHWPTVRYALVSLAHEYKHLLQDDLGVELNDRGVENWAEARVSEALNDGVLP